MITVADKPVALAGVMGSQATEISRKSTRICHLKLLSLMANQNKWSSTFVLNHLLALRKKGINVATVNEAHDAA